MTPSELLCQLISIPSVNPMGRVVKGDIYYETRLSDWLEAYFQSIGVPCERIEVSQGRANVLARYSSPNSKRTILLDAHQDTVPVDGMTIDPFSPKREGGTITGRGSADVKGGMATMLHAFSRLVRERPALSHNVVMSCSCDEESTLTGIRDLVTYWQSRKGISKLLLTPPDCAIVAEPTDLHAVVAHRGVVRFKVHAQGRACHSSDPTQGKNAIYSMARVVRRLEEIASELSRNVPSHPLCGQATLSVGRIEGGISVNIVPDHCVIEIDRRIVPGESPAAAFAKLKKAIASIGEGIDCDEPWITSPALGNENNGAIADRLLIQVAKLGLVRKQVGVAYCTNASTISETGIPSVVFGPGSIAQAHTVDEFIEVDQLDKASEVYYQFCCDDLR
ncbi:MAG: M20 family metallopeptidase [Pirellulaceae bacterium]|nr:M20 family metallopeptidase [Pirellulaceae bacterium]